MTDIDLKTLQRNLVLPTFLNMPLNVANLVLEKMGPHNLLRVRRVCRSLRIAVDEFGIHFGCIGLLLGKDVVEICWNGMDIDIFMSYQYRYIRYTEAANGSTNMNYNKQEKIIDGENFMERAAKDFKIVSKHAQRIEIFNSNDDNIVTTLNEFLKSETCILVEDIKLWNLSLDDVLTILTRFNAKKLKTIKLHWMKSMDQFEKIADLEQFKNAEVFRINSHKCTIVSTMIVHFFHFKFFNIYQMDEFPAQTAIQMRDDLLKRSTFQRCKIYFDKSKINPMEIAKVFKPDYVGGDEFNIEYSNGNDKFGISLEKEKNFQTNVIYFKLKRL